MLPILKKEDIGCFDKQPDAFLDRIEILFAMEFNLEKAINSMLSSQFDRNKLAESYLNILINL